MTPFYASLEQLNEEDAHPSFDIWSLGIMLYTLIAKKEPYTQIGITKRIKAIENNQREKLSDTYSQNLRDLVDFCLTLD
jgi:serine/threonine protein kinase